MPEVEALRRHVFPLLRNRRIESVQVLKPRIVRPDTADTFPRKILSLKIADLERAGKFLRFRLESSNRQAVSLITHLGMTGHIIVDQKGDPVARHAAVILNLDKGRFVFEDARQFGRMTADPAALPDLGPEPLGDDFTPEYLGKALSTSRQPVKVRLLDQSLIAGIGNIYASEALFLAGIRPERPSADISAVEVKRLHEAIRAVLERAIQVNVAEMQAGKSAYYQDAKGDFRKELRFQVYDRQGEPCVRCKAGIERIVQASRSSYRCPKCQR